VLADGLLCALIGVIALMPLTGAPRQIRKLLGQGDLKMVAGHGLVQGQRLPRVERTARIDAYIRARKAAS
jgi:hypothetical protein